jgi:subtilisin family serine protease
MKKGWILIGIYLLLSLLVNSSQTSGKANAGVLPGSERLSPEIRSALTTMKPEDRLTLIVAFEDQTSITIDQAQQLSERRQELLAELQSRSQTSQNRISSYLQQRTIQGQITSTVPFWIFNGMAVTASKQVIEELSSMPEVAQIFPNRVFYAPTSEVGTTSAQQNLSVVNATALWDIGVSGEGIVVANLDTGVSLDHPDLVTRWRGGSNSWFDPHGEHPDTPTDTSGHGTWTMGIMVGGDTSGSFVGVAPDARWIAAKIFNDEGRATSLAIHQSYQWLLDPDGDPTTDDAPHVVNNSWSFLSVGCYLDFQTDITSLRAAGILPIFAAGNAGPDPNTSVSPANNPGAFSVGAVDNLSVIHTGSSRGATDCGGSPSTFPSLVAPGVSIYSTGLNGGYVSATGTSMASPHAAGTLALLLNAFPDMPLDIQEQSLLQSALDLGINGPDNDYGNGQLDALEAFVWLGGVIPDTGAVTPPDLQDYPQKLFLPTVPISG